ncbi:YraN family protein [Thiomicrorhabdus indica]|uniref:YraN family protein n=1 Tax=Thiomicrorhabdus indica TaxID=2267253 RepID=UPI00102D909C|nr:YraN family protein [Thiomicrorhabdus indica]
MRLWPHLSRKIGRQKESDAKAWLERQSLKIIEENFHCKGGEIDLIALQSETTPAGKKHERLVFIEVKFRQTAEFGHPAEFVNLGKQQRIHKCAQRFLMKYPDYQNHPMRFDVIAMTADEPPQWIQNAF